jgi:ribonuclease P protein component
VRLVTLKRRADFLRVRGGLRWTTPGTVRNRIRRRLKAVVRETAAEHASAEFDYVVFARPAALDRRFAELRSDLIKAFARVPQGKARRRGR